MRILKYTSTLILLSLLFFSCKKDSIKPAPEIEVMNLGGAVGDSVKIVGKNFGSKAENVTVEFNGVVAQVSSITPTQIYAIVPQGAQSGTVTVTIGGKEGSFSGFQVIRNKWRRKTEFPGTSRIDQSTFMLDGKLYIAFGSNYKVQNYMNDVWTFDPTTNKWAQKANFTGEARKSAISFVANGKAYIGAGIGEKYTALKDFWKYDPLLDTWTQLNDLPYAYLWATSFVVNEKAYVHAIRSFGDHVLLEYQPTSDTWVPRSPFPGNHGIYGRSFVLNNNAILGVAIDVGAIYQTTKDMFAYNPSLDSWRRINYFKGVSLPAAFVIDETAYMGTGVMFENASYKFYSKKMWKFDLTTKDWELTIDFEGEARRNAIAFTANGRGYLGMGIKSDQTSETFLTDIWEYIP